jgi:hypothetical protein
MAAFINGAIDQGWLLMLTYCGVEELSEEAALFLTGDRDYAGMKIWFTHAVIPYNVDLESKEVDVVIGWERLPTARLKVKEIMQPDWAVTGFGLQPIGFARGILHIWPFGEATKGD